MNDHCLIIKPRATDYVLGANSPIELKSNLPSANWLPYTEFFERQLIANGDTDGCVLFTAQESFDAQMELLIQSGKIDATTLALFNSLGYMDTGMDGKPHFHSSPRFLQILTGNGFNGNALYDPWDVMRTYGVLPWKDLPVEGTMETYLTGLTDAMKAKAAQFLQAIGGKNSIQYHWVMNGSENQPAMIQALPTAPLCLGVNVGSDWNQINPPPPPSGADPGHAVMNYQIITNNFYVYDHYLPNPKDLINYPVIYALQGVVSFNPPPPSLPSNSTVPQIQNWLTRLIAWLKNLSANLNGIKGRFLKAIQK